MTTGETLLKISDYPFAYSFVAILGELAGYSISQNHLLFLGIAGVLVLLTITFATHTNGSIMEKILSIGV